MKQIRIINNLNDGKNLVAKSLIYDKIHKQNINWLKQPDQGESFSVNEDIDGNLIADIFKISITYHNIDSLLTYDLGFGDDLYILKVAINDREIDKSTLNSFVFDNDGDNVLDVYINKDPNNENVDIHWYDVSPEIDPVTVHINKYISNIPKLFTNIKDVICDAPTIKIEEGIFDSTNIESFKCDGVIKYIGRDAFRQCTNLKSIEFKDGLQFIEDNAFEMCYGLTGKLALPNSLISIGNNAFNECTSLTELTLGNSLTSIGDNAFNYCTSLTGELTLPNIISIGDNAFNGCEGLTKLIFGNSLTSIGNNAFNGCYGLTGKLTLPDSLISIGESAFIWCTDLTIYVPETIETIGNDAFKGVKKVVLKNYTRFDNWQTWGATEIVEE